MIQSKEELSFYIAADRIMNGYCPTRSLLTRVRETLLIGGGKVVVIKYLYHLRRYAYYYNTKHLSVWNKLMMVYEHWRWAHYSIKTGFSIGPNSLGYGTVIPHYGTIVVNENARIGPFSVLHTSTCIAGGGKIIGKGFYLSSGSQLVGEFNLGDYVSVTAHSLVNKSCGDNILLAGCPATIKKEQYPAWYKRDGERFTQRVSAVEELKRNFEIDR